MYMHHGAMLPKGMSMHWRYMLQLSMAVSSCCQVAADPNAGPALGSAPVCLNLWR